MVEAHRPLLKRLRRALWFTVAGSVILIAVALSLTRLLLPNLESYRGQVEEQASAALGQAVRIKTLRTRLIGLTPTVVLEDVRLLDSKAEQAVAHFREARVGIDLLESLKQYQLVTAELTVLGAELTVLRRVDGSLRVEGLAQDGESDPAAVEGIGRWLQAQQRITLRESRLHWRDLKRQRELSLDSVEVELANSAERHQLNIEVALPTGAGRALHLAFDVEGDVLRAGAWQGRGYLEATDIQLALLQQELGPIAGIKLQQGAVDLRLWGEWQEGRLQQVTATGALRNLHLQAPAGEVHLASLGGAGVWQRFGGSWNLRLGELQLARAATDKPEAIQAALWHDGVSWQLQFSAIELADVATLAVLAPLGDEQRDVVASLKPQGKVRQLRLILPDGKLAHVQGVFDQVSIAPWQQLPGVSGLSGRFVWSGNDGQLLLEGNNSVVDLPRLFRAPLALRQLQGNIELHRSAGGWLVLARNVRANNNDIHTVVDAEAHIPPQGSPYLNLQGQFWNGRAASAPLYMPAHIMDPDALSWLDRAFRDGTVTSGGVIFHGPLARFPFDQDEGRFEVDFRVRDAELFFQPGWPSIQHLDARVNFHNRSMLINATKGSMYDSRVEQAQVEIRDLHHPLLQVSGEARLKDGDTIRLLRDTPLRERLGDYVAQLRLEGPSDLKLNFALPLTDAVAQRQPLSVQGSVALQGNRLWLSDTFSIDAIEGELGFTESGLRSDGLQVRMLDEPASITIYNGGGDGDGRTVFAGRGQVQAAALQRLSSMPLLRQLGGRTAWQGVLTIPHGSDDGARLRLLSDLEGVSVNLPVPFGKTVIEPRELKAVYHFSGPQRGQLEAHYGEVASTALAFGEDGELARGTVHLGQGEAQLPERAALRLAGRLRELDLSAWADALQGEGDGPELKLPLLVEMDELHLKPAAPVQEEKRDTTAWQDLPGLELRVQRFGYGKLQFGQLVFDLQKSADALLLSNLMLSAQDSKLTGQARWQLQPRSHSSVKLQLESADLGALARQLQIATAITKGKAQVSAELQWAGPLPDYDPARLDGHLHIKIEDGLMAEVDPGAGRLLGLLSLQALPRRLMLDFRDMFQKGLLFSKIEGDSNIRAGNAYTNNLLMDTPSAQMKLEGRTGLAARDYDQLITVVPNLSGSAPVVGALAFGPQVGAVMLLFQKLLKGSVDEAARIQYKVTGSWDEPKIERLAAPKAEAGKTEAAPL